MEEGILAYLAAIILGFLKQASYSWKRKENIENYLLF